MTQRTGAARKARRKRASRTRGMPSSAELLKRIRQATKESYEALRAIDEDEVPPERLQEYWRNRYLARTAWEAAENAELAALVEEAERELAETAERTEALARDATRAGEVATVIDVFTNSLGVLGQVIKLFA